MNSKNGKIIFKLVLIIGFGVVIGCAARNSGSSSSPRLTPALQRLVDAHTPAIVEIEQSGSNDVREFRNAACNTIYMLELKIQHLQDQMRSVEDYYREKDREIQREKRLLPPVQHAIPTPR